MPRTSAAPKSTYVKTGRTRGQVVADDESDLDLDLYEDAGINREILSVMAGQGRSVRCYGSDEVPEFN